MNPMSHHQLGQSTHKEYEARYGSRYVSNESRQESVSPLGRDSRPLC